MRSEKNVAAILAVEIQELYRKFGLKTCIFQQVCAKILAVKKAYYKSRKNLQTKAKFSDSEFVSFRAKKQPREILRKDIEWYEAKLAGSSGGLGSVEFHAHRRETARIKRKNILHFDNKPTETTTTELTRQIQIPVSQLRKNFLP